MYESSTAEGSTANCTRQIRFYDAKGRHGQKRTRKFSKTIGIRCTHGETNSCTRSYAAARKDYCALVIWTAGCRKARERAICDRRMHMFSQDPRESRSKARTGTGAHNHGAAGNRPCGQSLSSDWGLWFPGRKLGVTIFQF
jgi:hypothetical protein